MRPGSITITSTPKPRTSKRRASESASTACLVAWYAPPPGNVSRPPIEDTLTILPQRWARIPGSTSWHMRTRPNTLVSNWRAELVHRDRLHGARLAVAGVVDEHAHGALLPRHLLDGGGHRRLVGHVERERAAAGRLQVGQRLGAARRGVDRPARGREVRGRGRPDARGASGDQDGLGKHGRDATRPRAPAARRCAPGRSAGAPARAGRRGRRRPARRRRPTAPDRARRRTPAASRTRPRR